MVSFSGVTWTFKWSLVSGPEFLCTIEDNDNLWYAFITVPFSTVFSVVLLRSSLIFPFAQAECG